MADCLELRVGLRGRELYAAPELAGSDGWVLRDVSRIALGAHVPLWLNGRELPADQIGLAVRRSLPYEALSDLMLELSPAAGWPPRYIFDASPTSAVAATLIGDGHAQWALSDAAHCLA